MRSDAHGQDLIREIKRLRDRGFGDASPCVRFAEAIEPSFRFEKEVHADMQGAKVALEQQGFAESARAMFDYCRDCAENDYPGTMVCDDDAAI